VFTCATLHNMIAMDDGLDRRWESDVTWEGADGLHGDTLVDDDDPDDVDIERVQSVHGRPVRAGDDYSAVGMVSAEEDDDTEEQAEHVALRQILIDHFYIMWLNRSIVWRT